MAEPIGLASGLLTLTIYAIQSSTVLHDTIQSFRSRPKPVRDLIEELQALKEILIALHNDIESTSSKDLSLLDLPLLRCGKACMGMREELKTRVLQSNNADSSSQDWTVLKYMGDDIDAFRRMLAGYKLTISVALVDANLRKSCLTANLLENHRDLVAAATDDLQAHLETVNDKLNTTVGQASEFIDNTTDLQDIKENKSSILRCLHICQQLSQHIDHMPLVPEVRPKESNTTETNVTSEKKVGEGLQSCKNDLTLHVAKLEKHMNEITDRLIWKSKAAITSEDELAELSRLRQQWDATRECIDECLQTDRQLKENVSSIENCGTGDTVQFMVSTNGNAIYGRNRGLGWKTRQIGGNLSDDAVVQLSQDMLRANWHRARDPLSEHTSRIHGDLLETEAAANFGERYGRGIKLTSEQIRN